MNKYDITAVICTYNRSRLLPDAIERMLGQEMNGLRYELIIVDNNSSDDTREVIESCIAGHPHVRYLFEGKQGLSHARNAGVQNARAPIVAFTDDDVRVAPDWLASIVRAFAKHPEVAFVGGRVLPEWPRNPPAWLTKEHWSPLALLDRGNQPIHLDHLKSFVLVGANLAVRIKAFEKVGLFLPKFQRVKDSIGSTEDHDFQLRLHKAGIQGLYSPDIVVTAAVQEERLTKTYHRRWHAGHGRFSARMGTDHIANDSAPTLFEVPSYLYRRLGWSARQWAVALFTGNSSTALMHENEIRYLLNYMHELSEQPSDSKRRLRVIEVASFAGAIIRRKLSTRKRVAPSGHQP